jgi:uncharacterized protein YjiS (DUF1127 family)
MRAHQQDYPLVTSAIDIFADWWKRRRDRHHDLDLMAKSDLRSIAKDIGVSTADLQVLDQSESKLLLPRMMKALRLDPKTVADTEPAMFRDMQRVCAMCGEKKRCERALARGDAASTYTAFCGNTYSLKALA